ncbi:MAG: RDD family protein [Sulfurovum sp.]|nr:MAG: RDD family protein [Sulfurovum sp.]
MARKNLKKQKNSSIKQEQGRRVATNAQKFKAGLTDSFMILMPIMYIVFYFVMDGRDGFAQHQLNGWFYIFLPMIVIRILFFYFNSQTMGYRAYDIELVDGLTLEKASLFSIIFREFSSILSILTVFGFLMMFFRKDKKALHDILSNTAVVQK